MGILRPVGLTVGPRAVSRIVSAVAGQQSSGGKSEQTEPQPTRLPQRPAFPAVGGSDDRPLEDVAKVPEVVLAVPSQAKGGFGELLLQQAWAELDDKVSLDGTAVPQTMLRPRWNGQALAGSELESRSMDGKRCRPGDNREVRLLHRVNVRDTHAAARRQPGFVLHQLAIGFRSRLQKPDALAVERIFNYRADDGRVTSQRVFCGVCQKWLAGARNLHYLCDTAVNSNVRTLVFANFLAPNMTSTYTDVAEQVGRRLGVPATLVEGISVEQLRQASVDVAFLCGLPYVRLLQEQPGMLRLLAAPVLHGPRYRGRPVYFSDVIVRRDSPWQSFADLRGQSWAHSVGDSYSGCLLSRYQLQQMGERERFFGEVTYSGGHQQSIRRVVDGGVTASAIDSHVLGVEQLRNPRLAQALRVVAVFGPSSIPPVVATTRLPDDLAAGVGSALAALSDDPASRARLARGLIQRYVPVADKAYDEMRRMLEVVERRPPSVRVSA